MPDYKARNSTFQKMSEKGISQVLVVVIIVFSSLKCFRTTAIYIKCKFGGVWTMLASVFLQESFSSLIYKIN